jgi:alkanesulfonate monooxygenase SsuD/methylene tetrahydromethanopterin reductase-like flavin-dependent oxidoreductase (luciferase family)
MGWQFISAHFAPPSVIASHWQAYAEGCKAAARAPDPDAWRVARVVHVGPDDAAARAHVRDPAGPYCDFWRYLIGVLSRARQLALLKDDPQMPDDAVTVEYLIERFTIAGDPQSVARQILDLRHRVGAFAMLVSLAIELTDRARILESMTLLARETMPRVNAALARGA